MRAARTAGKKPPSTPITIEAISAVRMMRGVGSKVNTTSEKLAKFIIEKRTFDSANDARAPTC